MFTWLNRGIAQFWDLLVQIGEVFAVIDSGVRLPGVNPCDLGAELIYFGGGVEFVSHQVQARLGVSGCVQRLVSSFLIVSILQILLLI